MGESVRYRQRRVQISCPIVGLGFVGAAVAGFVSDPGFGNTTVLFGAMALFGLVIAIRGPRAATAADHSGIVIHTMAQSRFIPWCHVADLRVGQAMRDAGLATYMPVAMLTDGERLEIASGLSTLAQTVTSEARLHARTEALQQLRARHQCTGFCGQDSWFYGHHAPGTRPTADA